MGSSDNSSRDEAGKGFWTAGRIAITLIGVGLLSALSFSSCNSNESNNQPVSSASPSGANNPVRVVPPTAANNVPPAAPPGAIVTLPQGVRDTKLQTLDGESLKLSDYSNKVLIVNIWATWCGPCRQEMPELVKMSNEYKSRGLVVLGLATTYNEQNDPKRVRDYIKAQNI